MDVLFCLTPLVVDLFARQQTTAPVTDVREVGSISLIGDISSATKQTFMLTPSDKPLVITRLSPSCHCASAMLSGTGNTNAVATLPLLLAPNTSATVTVSVDLSELRPGAFTKSVVVYAKPASPPDAAEFVLARLTVRGNLLPAVTFATDGTNETPAASNLSVLPLGTLDLNTFTPARERGMSAPRNSDGSSNKGGVILTAKPDPRLLRNAAKDQTAAASPAVPPLVSSHPGIRAERLQDAPGGTLRYRITAAPDAPIGSLLGTLAFQPPVTDKSIQAIAWRSASLVVTGEIVGSVAASPQVVAFGIAQSTGTTPAPSLATPKAGDISQLPLSRTVTLTARDAKVFTGITVECDNPAAVSAKLLPPATGAETTATERTLLVTLAPDAARKVATGGGWNGFFQARVTVRLQNGQRLVLPVSAFLQQGVVPSPKQETTPPAPKG